MAKKLGDLTAKMSSGDKNLLKRLDELEREVRRLSTRQIPIRTVEDLTGDLGLLQAGEFRSGNGVEPGSGFTGGRFGYPGFTYNGTEYFLIGVVNDVAQVGLALADGKLYAGAGAVVVDANGIGIVAPNGSIDYVASVTWDNAGDRVAAIGGYYSPGPAGVNALRLEANVEGGEETGNLVLAAFPLTGSGAAIAEVGLGSSSLSQSYVWVNASKFNVDFIVSGDTDANLLRADASTDRVGIGTATPSTKLDVNGTVNATAVTVGGSAIVVDAINDAATTTAPSQNAVFDALALKAPLASPTFTGTVGAAAISASGNVGVGGFLGLSAATELTIAAGVVTATKSYHTIDTQADAATDDLDTINGGSEGDILILKPETGTRDVTVKHNTGNILLAGLADFTMLLPRYRIVLLKDDAGKWCEITRSA